MKTIIYQNVRFGSNKESNRAGLRAIEKYFQIAPYYSILTIKPHNMRFYYRPGYFATTYKFCGHRCSATVCVSFASSRPAGEAQH